MRKIREVLRLKSRSSYLDDWGLAPFTAAQRRDMLELLDDRYGKRSTLASQMPVDK